VIFCSILLSFSFILCLSFFIRTVVSVSQGAAHMILHVPLALFVLGCVAAVPLTHAVTGKRKHASSWRFFQPLKGGKKFVVTQGASWILFGLAVVLACFWFYSFAQKLAFSREVIATASSASVAAILSQILMVASIFVFEPQQRDESLMVKFSLIDGKTSLPPPPPPLHSKLSAQRRR